MDSSWDFWQSILGLSVKSEDIAVWQMCARAVLAYIALVALVRMGKKRSLGEATAFDAMLIIIIGSVTARAITGGAPLLPSFAADFCLVGLHWLLSASAMRSQWLSRLLKGSSTKLVTNGQLDRAALAKSHMSIDDLDEDLRQTGVAGLECVREARLERSGRLSVIRKSRCDG